jgi:hypothetical protein
LLVLSVLVGVVASPAAAEQTTLGVAAPVPDENDLFVCSQSACTDVQTGLPGGSVQAPAAGRIVAWWAMGDGDNAQLRVFTLVPPIIQGKLKAIGTSSKQTLSRTIVTHFPTDLPVEGGDFIGVTVGFHAGVRAYADPNSNDDFFPNAFPDGTSGASADQFKQTLELGAQFIYTPVVSGVAVSSGSTAGGETVVITGNHLTDSTEVRFGSTPATNSTIDSNTQIAATAPAESAGVVDVTVSGPGGTSARSGSDQYAFVTPTAIFSPAVVNFGDQLVGSTSAVRATTLTNTGSVQVVIGPVTLGGPDASDFTPSFDGCAGRSVAPGGSCAVSLSFTPGAAGARDATVRLEDDATGGPHDVILTGNGTTSTATPPNASGPSNAFTLSRAKLNKKRGTATIVATVPGPGNLVLKVKGLKRLAKAASGAGEVELTVKPTRKMVRTLDRKGEAKVVARVTYTPTGGDPNTESKRLTLKLRRGSR